MLVSSSSMRTRTPRSAARQQRLVEQVAGLVVVPDVILHVERLFGGGREQDARGEGIARHRAARGCRLLPGCAATAFVAARPSRVVAASVTAKLSPRPSSGGRLAQPVRHAMTSAAMHATLRGAACAARGRGVFNIEISGIVSGFVTPSVALFQPPIDPQRGERARCPGEQIQADVAKPEIGGQPERHQRRESRTDQPRDVRGERGAGVTVFRLEARVERAGRLSVGETQQPEADQDEHVLPERAAVEQRRREAAEDRNQRGESSRASCAGPCRSAIRPEATTPPAPSIAARIWMPRNAVTDCFE